MPNQRHPSPLTRTRHDARTECDERSRAVPPICALILVDCLVTKDAPNGLICMG